MKAPYVGLILDAWRHQVLPVHAHAWSQLLNDPNPIHWDRDAVARLGIGSRPVNQGPANITYLYNMLAANWPQARIVALDARMTGTIWVGDDIEVTGEVVSVSGDPTGIFASCALDLHAVSDRLHAVRATATVFFASVEHDTSVASDNSMPRAVW